MDELLDLEQDLKDAADILDRITTDLYTIYTVNNIFVSLHKASLYEKLCDAYSLLIEAKKALEPDFDASKDFANDFDLDSKY